MTATRGVEARRHGGGGDRGRGPPARERAPSAGWLALSLQPDAGLVTPARVGYFTDRVRVLGGIGGAVTDATGTQLAPGSAPAAPVVAHEAVHAGQFAAAEAGAPPASRSALEAEAAAGASRLAAGHPFAPRLGTPAGAALAWDPAGGEGGGLAVDEPLASFEEYPTSEPGDLAEYAVCESEPDVGGDVCELVELPPLPEMPAGLEVTPAERQMIQALLYEETLTVLWRQAVAARQARERNDREAFGSGSGIGVAPGLTFGIRRRPSRASAFGVREGVLARERRADDLLTEALNLVGLSSPQAIAFIQSRFLDMFTSKAVEVANFLLDRSEEEATSERWRYRFPSTDPGVIDRVRAAAVDIAGTQIELLNMMKYAVQTSTHYIQGPRSIDPKQIHQYMRGSEFYGHPDVQTSFAKYQARKQKYAAEFPVLAAEGLDYVRLAEMSDERLAAQLAFESGEVLEAIETAREQLDRDNVWDLSPVIAHTESLLGITPDSRAGQIVREFRTQRAWEKMWVDIFLAAAAIALTAVAIVASGGLGLAALAVEGAATAGVAAIGVVQAYRTYDDYRLQSAARESAFDRANAIGNQDPSLAWLAFDVALALVDVTQAISAFRRLAPVARGIVELRQAAAAGESIDSAAALTRLREAATATGHGDEFVERIMRSAERLAEGPVDTAARELHLQSVLLNPSGPAWDALVAGDRRALQGLLAEYGNWERLQSFLDIARGEEALRSGEAVARQYDHIGQNLVLFRNEVINDVARRFGAEPLGTASTRRMSDVDVSTYGLRAGEDVIRAEKFMAARFGPNWSEAMRMNFYTDASRLAYYAMDELLATGLQATDRLPAMLRGMGRWEATFLLQEIGDKAEIFSAARQLRYAQQSPELAERILATVPADLRPQVRQLAAYDEAAELARRHQLLREQDAIKQRLVGATDADRPQVIRELTLNQIELNFHTVEATIAPGALRQIAVPGSTLGGWEAASAAESHFADALHILADEGGSKARAAGRYELYKYMGRFTKAARWAGEGADPRLARLEELAAPIAGKGGDRTIPETMSEADRLAAFELFENYYFDAMPRMRAHASAHPHEWGTTGTIARGTRESLEQLPTAPRPTPVPNIRELFDWDDEE